MGADTQHVFPSGFGDFSSMTVYKLIISAAFEYCVRQDPAKSGTFYADAGDLPKDDLSVKGHSIRETKLNVALER